MTRKPPLHGAPSEELDKIAEILLADLIEARRRDTVTPDKPITKKAILAGWDTEGVRRPKGVNERTLRAAVALLTKRGNPIAVTNAGYFYAMNAHELQPSIAFLKSMAVETLAHLRGLETAFAHQETLAELRKQYPAVEKLVDEFQAVLVGIS